MKKELFANFVWSTFSVVIKEVALVAVVETNPWHPICNPIADVRRPTPTLSDVTGSEWC